MRKTIKKVLGAVMAVCISGSMIYTGYNYSNADAASGYVVENLDRGVCAVSTGSGMMVNWRFLANDADNTVFKLYRNDSLKIGRAHV